MYIKWLFKFFLIYFKSAWIESPLVLFTIYQLYTLSYQTNCLELNVVNWQATLVDYRCWLQKLQSKICYIEVSLFLPLSHFVLILRFCYLLLIFFLLFVTVVFGNFFLLW